MRRPFQLITPLLLVTASLSACTLEPKYVQPVPAVPPTWPTGPAYSGAANVTRAEPSPADYRQIFRDPKLQTLIARALVGNQDLRLALANVQIARGQLTTQRAALLPQVDASASARYSDDNSAGSRTQKDYSADIGLTAFEIDLFGRLRSLSKGAFQDYLASESAARAARLTLIASVADAYLTLATDRSLLAIANETAASASRSVELTGARLKAGVAPRTDLRQAETVLAQAQADRADLITLVAQDRNALELLVGGPVAEGELPANIESVDGLLGEMPAGLSSLVLLQRPDVMQAEHSLRAANARIGAARAAFFPQISLTALAGVASGALSSLFTNGAFGWQAGPSISLPIFDGGANLGNLRVAKGRREAALATYQKAIQTAFQEVADALARRGTIADKYGAQAKLAAAASDSYRLTEARYRGGVDSFLSSLDAQRTLYTARRALANARLIRARNLVELYRALGGDLGTSAEESAKP